MRGLHGCLGAICGWNTTTATITLERGHWRSSSLSLNIFICSEQDSDNGEACIGGSDPGINGENYCRSGHSGPLCRTCEDDHFYDQEKCVDCPSDRSIGRRLGIASAILLAMAGLVWALYHLANWHGRLRRLSRWVLGQIAAIGPTAKSKIAFAFLQFCLLLPSVYEV